MYEAGTIPGSVAPVSIISIFAITWRKTPIASGKYFTELLHMLKSYTRSKVID